MATVRPRVQVCLDQETKDLYDACAEAMGMATSRLIAQVCVDASPAMAKVLAVIQKAKHSQDKSSILEFAKAFAVDARQELAAHQVDLEDAIAASKSKTKAKAKPKA